MIDRPLQLWRMDRFDHSDYPVQSFYLDELATAVAMAWQATEERRAYQGDYFYVSFGIHLLYFPRRDLLDADNDNERGELKQK